MARVVALETLQQEIAEQLRQINTVTYEELRNGGQVDGFALQAGKKSRSITDEKAAVEFLSRYVPKDDLFASKFIGLTAVEKVLSKAGIKPDARESLLSNIVTVTTGNPVMVRV